MKFKKIVALSSALLVASMSLVGCSNKNNNEQSNNKTIKVGMVADVGGINDESFNQSAWEGLQQAEKELGIEAKVIESKTSFRIFRKYRNFSRSRHGFNNRCRIYYG